MRLAAPPPGSLVKQWPRAVAVEIIEQGLVVAILLRESDGTISAIRIPVEQLAD